MTTLQSVIVPCNTRTIKMKIISGVLLVALASAVTAEVSISTDEVMCNCKSPNNKMWTNFKKMASEKCNRFPAGTPGHSSCVANALGYLQNDGRTFNYAAIAKDFEDLPFVKSCDPKLPVLSNPEKWQWHGKFSYADLDRGITSYFDCIKKTMQQNCSADIVKKVETCPAQ